MVLTISRKATNDFDNFAPMVTMPGSAAAFVEALSWQQA